MSKKRKKNSYPHKTISPSAKGLVLIICSLCLLLSLLSFQETLPAANWLGLIGYTLAFGFLKLFGLAAFTLPIYFGTFGTSLLLKKEFQQPIFKLVYFITFLCSLSLLLSALATHFPSFASAFSKKATTGHFPKTNTYDPYCLRTYIGGVPFQSLYSDLNQFSLNHILGTIGSFIIFVSMLLLSFLLLTEIPLSRLGASCKFMGQQLLSLKEHLFKRRSQTLRPIKAHSTPFKGDEDERPHFPHLLSTRNKDTNVLTPTTPVTNPTAEIISPPKNLLIKPTFIGENYKNYTLPPATLLTQVKPTPASQERDLKRQAEILEETLLSFGIEAKVGDIQCGPTITLFEVHPAIGVKVQKIKALENDIALNMQARSIRIIAPIPGKAAVGIEVPNLNPQEVGFREMLESYQRRGKPFHIPLLLGKRVNGEDMWSDLTKMPHLIIAGATGSGKSVCINTIAMSIAMNACPDEIKLVLVDPKKVELSSYSPLPHMIAPVITEPHGAKEALNWLVREMEKRYEIFRKLGIRNILGFNSRKVDKSLEMSLDLDVPKHLPYIVVIIDELADLMMISTSDIETPIARIAQMARAVGIHLILATQRPSREVITGLIKANFPSRIAFKVASRINSQIILDETGAETLLGNGDMLFMPPGTSSLLRTQGAFIRDEDINRVIEFICEQAPPNYLISSFDNYRPNGVESEEEESSDSLYGQAKSLVFDTGNASTTFLQRKLKIGYARAASLMDNLELNGIIGPQEGAKPRKIFYPSADDNE